MSKFDTKNLIYEVNKLNKENRELQEKLKELEERLKACESCAKNNQDACGNDWCHTKEEK